MKIYVASSWRNNIQPDVVLLLKYLGHDVYDFRNPPGQSGFGWGAIGENWQEWSIREYRDGLNHPLAIAGYESDRQAMEWADAFVLVLPCGRSAHLELGWAAGRGKHTVIYSLGPTEPELMYKMVNLVTDDWNEVVTYLKGAPE